VSAGLAGPRRRGWGRTGDRHPTLAEGLAGGGSLQPSRAHAGLAKAEHPGFPSLRVCRRVRALRAVCVGALRGGARRRLWLQRPGGGLSWGRAERGQLEAARRSWRQTTASAAPAMPPAAVAAVLPAARALPHAPPRCVSDGLPQPLIPRQTFFARTHLGHLLHAGDTAVGYDLSTANLVDPELERAVHKVGGLVSVGVWWRGWVGEQYVCVCGVGGRGRCERVCVWCVDWGRSGKQRSLACWRSRQGRRIAPPCPQSLAACLPTCPLTPPTGAAPPAGAGPARRRAGAQVLRGEAAAAAAARCWRRRPSGALRCAP
jgi:hypothetical protein